MATNIVLKRSATEGSAPATGDLELGELALNTYDGKMYMKKTVSGTSSIVELTGTTAATSSAFAYQAFKYTATSNQTTFTGSDANSVTLAYTSGAIQVFLNGILLDAADYTASNGTSIVLGSGAGSGDILYVASYKGTDPLDYFKYTATNGQTSFSGNDANSVSLVYTAGNINVYLNGVLLDATDYTATTGTSVVLGSGATTGDILTIWEFNETGLTDVSADTTPQLSGDLDVNGNDIVSTSNAHINVIPNGTGNVTLQTDTLQLGSSGENVTVTTSGTGDVTLNTNSGTNSGSIVIADGANNNITLTPNGTGIISLAGDTTIADGSNDFDIASHDGTNGLKLAGTVVTTTAAELNIVDGGTSATSTTLAAADRLLVNDNGTMVQVALSDFETFFESAIDTFSTIDINGGSIDGATVGANSASSGAFTTLSASGALTGTLGTAAQTNITSLGTLTALTVDNIALNGNTMTTTSADFTLDASHDIILDADGGNIKVKDAGTTFFDIQKSGNDAQLLSRISDGDLVFRGNDGGSTIDALTLDMSEGGVATFRDKIVATELDISGDIDIDGTANLDIVDIDGAVDMASTLAVTGVISPTTHIDMPDDAKILLGTGDDLEIYHDGNNSIISETGDGGLLLYTAGVATSGFYKIGGEEIATFEPDGPVTLYWNDAVKFATVSAGAQITGSLGIGTAPATGNAGNTAGLHIKNSAPFIRLQDDTSTLADWELYAFDHKLYFYDNEDSAATMVLDGGGNVGIGTAAPTYTLDVVPSSASAFRVEGGTNGTDVNCVIKNTGTTAGDDSLLNLDTVAGAGDPVLRFTIAGTESWAVGIDNTDTDKFKITNASTLGNNSNADDRFVIHGATIGLGTSEPNSFNSSVSNLVIRDSGSAGICISTGTSATGYVAFNDGVDTTVEGLIAYNQSNDTMSFRTASVDDRLTINSSGAAAFSGTLAVAGVLSPANHIDMPSDQIIKLGGSDEFQIVYDSGGSAIMSETGGGNMKLRATNLDIEAHDGNTKLATFVRLGAVSLYYANAIKLVTVTGGVHLGAGSVNATLSTESAGTSNLTLGVNAGNSIVSGGNYNVCVGDEAGTAITTGDDNTFVGYAAGDALDEGKGNVAIGMNCLGGDTFGCRNIAIGHAALITQNFTSETNAFNIAIGYSAGAAITDGTWNTLIGGEAGDAIAGGDGNTGVGYKALGACTESNNVAVGNEAAANLTTGARNVYVGYKTGPHSGGAGTGADNVCVGNRAGYVMTSAAGNVAVGTLALSALTVQGLNTAVGDSAGDSLVDGYRNVLIGHRSDVSATNGSYQNVLGEECIGYGNYYTTVGSGSGDNRVHVQHNTNATWARVSDVRYKKEIQDNTDCGLDFINDLRPVTFKKKKKSEIDASLPDYDETDSGIPTHPDKLYGLIAQEVKEVIDEHNITDFGGWTEEETTGIQGISEAMFVHPLIKAIQELSAKVEELEKKLEDK